MNDREIHERLKNDTSKNAAEKEYRRELFASDTEEYKNQRKQFIRDVSKNFRTINNEKKGEMNMLEEETRLANKQDMTEKELAGDSMEETLRKSEENTPKESEENTPDDLEQRTPDESAEGTLKESEESTLDYSIIKEYFAKASKEFPLGEDECTGLTKAELREITPCGTYCGSCDDYGVVCDGCRNREGRPIWYQLYDREETCIYYQCCKNNGKHDCSECGKLPCKEFFEYPDPNMTEDVKQWWFKLRMDNYNKLRPTNPIEIEDSFGKNVKKYQN